MENITFDVVKLPEFDFMMKCIELHQFLTEDETNFVNAWVNFCVASELPSHVNEIGLTSHRLAFYVAWTVAKGLENVQ